jgi:hypothetical protein
MNNDLTDITILLDCSTSMLEGAKKPSTIEGYNKFLTDQQSAPGDCLLTLVHFNHGYHPKLEARPIRYASILTDKTYNPSGNTALIDAIGRAIDDTGKRLKYMAEHERPARVVMAIITDGEENSSHHYGNLYNTGRIRGMINHQRDKYRWQFVFMGTEEGSIVQAVQMGIPVANTMQFAESEAAIGASYRAMSSNLRQYRCGLVADMAFDKDQRAEAGE